MSAEGRRKIVAVPQKSDGACLTVVLRENAAVGALRSGDALPGEVDLIDDLLPAELVGIVLRDKGLSGPVLRARYFEREYLDECHQPFHREDRDDQRSDPEALGDDESCNY